MKTKIEEAASSYAYKEIIEGEYNSRTDDIEFSFIAGAEFMQGEINEIKTWYEQKFEECEKLKDLVFDLQKQIIPELKAQNEIMREALTDITSITRRDGNANEYEGAEAYISKKALKKVGDE